MANFCLIKPLADLFKQKLKNGEIDPQKLADMSSEERHKFFADFLGEDNAKQVNSLFESKLLLKNQKAGMITWAKSVAGLKEATRRDLISRIERLDKVLNPADQTKFLHDLASTKLGLDVTQEEAKNIADLSKNVQESRTAMESGGDRMTYGRAVVALRNYMSDLKDEANKTTLVEALKNPLKTAYNILGLSKSLKFSMDVASFFHQGAVAFYTHPGIWFKSAKESLVNAVKQFGGKNVMSEIDAQTFASKNYDKYVKMKLDIGTTEDPLPSRLPEKIPLYGRAYKATEVAFTGFLHILRRNIADSVIENFDKKGIDMTDKKNLEALGKIINSATGRGNLGKFETAANEVNVLFASIRQLKGDFDVITAHQLDSSIPGSIKMEARRNLIKVIVGQAALMTMFSVLMPGSIEWNPTSSDFGKVKIGNQRFNLPGTGINSIAILAARIATMSIKSSTTGKVTKLNSGNFGGATALDLFNSFFENRFSPIAALARDYLAGKDPQGNKFDLPKELGSLLLPIGGDAFTQLQNDPQANKLLGFIGNEVGLYSSDYSASKNANWNDSNSKELLQFKSRVGQKTFDNANTKYNRDLQAATDKLLKSNTYKGLSDADKQKAVTDLKTTIQSRIFKSYHFKYKVEKSKSKTVKDLINESIQ